jgi:GNAT superfamily N-acetyltransferase
VGDPTSIGQDAAPVPLHSDQVGQAAETLTGAFMEGALGIYVFPDVQRRRRHLPSLFAQVLRDGMRDGEVFVLGPVLAVAVWIPPQLPSSAEDGVINASKAEWLDTRRLWTADERDRFDRYVEYSKALRARLIPEPHAYLDVIGVQPSYKGRGLGSLLLAPQLARYSSEGTPCFLITGLARNLPFYERLGFRVMEESDIPGSATHIWAMRRD